MDIHSITKDVEKISDSYAVKFVIDRNSDWFILKLQEELGELIQSYLMMIGQARTKQKSDKELQEDFGDEVADVFCHVLLLANHHGIDIEQKVNDKWLIWSSEQQQEK